MVHFKKLAVCTKKLHTAHIQQHFQVGRLLQMNIHEKTLTSCLMQSLSPCVKPTE